MAEQALPQVGTLSFSNRRGFISKLGRIAARKPLGTLAIAIVASLWILSFLAPVLAPYNWNELFVGPKLQGPSSDHLFGTDFYGGDVFSRVLYGGRVTLMTSLLASVMSMLIATVVGCASGFLGGKLDLIVQRVSDALQALPNLVVLLVVTALFASDRLMLIFFIALLTAPAPARVLRSHVLSLRSLPYVEAATSIGCSNFRILYRHILPNTAHLIIVLFTGGLGVSMLIVTTLAFLGVIGSQTPDWGGMLNISSQQYFVIAPWTAIFPGGAITLAVLGYNLAGDALRDLLDPRLRGA